MISNNDFALIAALDLNSIKTKLMHKESGEGWSVQRATAIETEYRRFLYLMKANPQGGAAPLVDVDTFWHYHILDTVKYARDCQQIFGYFLHHDPSVGLVGDNGIEMQQQAGERMRELYESTFGLSYVRPMRTDSAPEAADVQTACGHDRGQAANSAWCAVPGGFRAADVRTAWCAVPGGFRAADVQTAWCAVPGGFRAADVQTAWCAVPGGFRAADVQIAWCAVPGGFRAADVQTAWCAVPGGFKAADVQSASSILQAA